MYQGYANLTKLVQGQCFFLQILNLHIKAYQVELLELLKQITLTIQNVYEFLQY